MGTRPKLRQMEAAISLQGNSADAQGEVPGQVRRVQLEPVVLRRPASRLRGLGREFGLQLALRGFGNQRVAVTLGVHTWILAMGTEVWPSFESCLARLQAWREVYHDFMRVCRTLSSESPENIC